ncbi:MAG: site-specific integrase [Candidatus Bathyarchaeia archaeon]
MEPKIELENLEDYTEIKGWLSGKSQGSKFNYLSAMKAFIEYTKLTPKAMIDLAEEDRKKSVREQGEPERKVKAFFEWLLNEYTQKSRGVGRREKKKAKQKGVSRNLAVTYCNAIRSFYKANGFPLNLRIPKAAPKKENFKLILRVPEVKRLIDVATNVRDRAIILTLFQSGMGVSELCNLTYGDVVKGLEENEEPLHIHLIRKKELVEYDTFLGKDAIDALKSYLDERRRNGEILKYDTPLFIKRFIKSNSKSKAERLTPTLIEATFRALAVKSGLVSQERLERADINPCRPHTLRSSFISILKTAGCPNVAVEYMVGHAVPDTEKAYWQVRVEELKNLYKKYEKHISISGMIDTEKLETLEQDAKRKSELIEVLLENGKLKDQKISELTQTLDQIKNQLNYLDSELDFHRMEQIARFVRAKAPTEQELQEFLNRKGLSPAMLKREELACISYDSKNNRWIYQEDSDTYGMAY